MRRKTADLGDIAKTLMASPSSQPSTGPSAESQRFAQTYDSDRFSAELVAKVSVAWPAKFDAGATPRTSIKADARAGDEATKVNIQSRVLRAVNAPGNLEADYELLSELGKGGMGIVHNARQASIGRTVALKKIKPEKAGEPEAQRTFHAEAVVTGDLEHPNIVPIYDMGEDDTGVLFYAMKRVKGRPWDKVIGEKSFDENLEIWMKVADAVAFAHSRGVVHRDLKPENVMLGDFGEVLLMDWGLALVLHSPVGQEGGHGGHAGLYAAGNGGGAGDPRRPRRRHLPDGRDPVRDPHRTCAAQRTHRYRLPDGRSAKRDRAIRRGPASWSTSP